MGTNKFDMRKNKKPIIVGLVDGAVDGLDVGLRLGASDVHIPQSLGHANV